MTGRTTAGVAALGVIALVIGGAFAGLLVAGAGDWARAVASFDSYLARVVRFTLW